MNMTKGLETDKVSDIIRNKLTEYITPYLMQVIIRDNINEKITEDEIREEYVTMISDLLRMEKTIQDRKTDK